MSIPIISESIELRYTKYGLDKLYEAIKNNKLITYIKDKYSDNFEASIDLALCINNIAGSVLALPIICDVVLKSDDKTLDSLFIELDNDIYDVYNCKCYNKDPDSIEMRKPSNMHNHVSPSGNYYNLMNLLYEILGDKSDE